METQPARAHHCQPAPPVKKVQTRVGCCDAHLSTRSQGRRLDCTCWRGSPRSPQRRPDECTSARHRSSCTPRSTPLHQRQPPNTAPMSTRVFATPKAPRTQRARRRRPSQGGKGRGGRGSSLPIDRAPASPSLSGTVSPTPSAVAAGCPPSPGARIISYRVDHTIRGVIRRSPVLNTLPKRSVFSSCSSPAHWPKDTPGFELSSVHTAPACMRDTSAVQLPQW